MRYVRPFIKVCDYISRNALMITIGEGTTDTMLGKVSPYGMADDTDPDEDGAAGGVWDN